LGREPFLIERIAGGITNHNFVVHAGGESYVARLGEELPLLGIDRRNEAVCHRAVSAWGLAPEVAHHEEGLLITRFIAGNTLVAADVRRRENLVRAAGLLHRLHEAWDTLSGEVLYFCPFQTIRTYADSAARLQAELPGGIAAVLEDTRRLARRIAPFRPVLCHNDLMPANLIHDGNRLWLIDWEYAGVGHPLFDLANIAANAAFSDEQDRALLAAYHRQVEDQIDSRELDELRIFKAVSLLRDSLWGTIQTVASDIDFDYHRYAAETFQAYQEARARLETA
jgi:thiamine kinase-like enzyme